MGKKEPFFFRTRHKRPWRVPHPASLLTPSECTVTWNTAAAGKADCQVSSFGQLLWSWLWLFSTPVTILQGFAEVCFVLNLRLPETCRSRWIEVFSISFEPRGAEMGSETETAWLDGQECTFFFCGKSSDSLVRSCTLFVLANCIEITLLGGNPAVETHVPKWVSHMLFTWCSVSFPLKMARPNSANRKKTLSGAVCVTFWSLWLDGTCAVTCSTGSSEQRKGWVVDSGGRQASF